MFEIVKAIREQVLREFGLGDWETFFYRTPHTSTGRCASCERYFELLDACPVRIGSAVHPSAGHDSK